MKSVFSPATRPRSRESILRLIRVGGLKTHCTKPPGSAPPQLWALQLGVELLEHVGVPNTRAKHGRAGGHRKFQRVRDPSEEHETLPLRDSHHHRAMVLRSLGSARLTVL
jgi:hypothetical protein